MEVIKQIIDLDIPDDAKTTMIKEFSDPNQKVKLFEKTPDKNVYIVNRDDIYYYYLLSKCAYYTPCADRETLDDLYGWFHTQRDTEVLKKVGTNLYFLSNATPIRNGYFRLEGGYLEHTHYYISSVLKFTYLETKHVPITDHVATVYGTLAAGEWKKYDLPSSSRDLVHPTYEKYAPIFGYEFVTNILIAVFDKITNINTLAIIQTGPGEYFVTINGTCYSFNTVGTPCLISIGQINQEPVSKTPANKKFKQVLLEAALPQFQEYIKKKLLKNAQYGFYKIDHALQPECLTWLIQFCKDNDLRYTCRREMNIITRIDTIQWV